MGEYGAVVSQNTGAAAGAGGGGSSGLVSDIEQMADGLLDGLSGVPVEFLFILVAVIIGGSLLLSMRPST